MLFSSQTFPPPPPPPPQSNDKGMKEQKEFGINEMGGSGPDVPFILSKIIGNE